MPDSRRRILFVQASPHGLNSRGAHLALTQLQDFRESFQLVVRDVVTEPLAPLSSAYGLAIASRAEASDPLLAQSNALIDELDACDALLISTPMHNFTVPAALKLWIDHVLRHERSFTAKDGHKTGLLRNRPALVLVRSGGVCTGSEARQADFLTPYLQLVLATVGIHDVQFVYLPGKIPPPQSVEQAREALTQLVQRSTQTQEITP